MPSLRIGRLLALQYVNRLWTCINQYLHLFSQVSLESSRWFPCRWDRLRTCAHEQLRPSKNAETSEPREIKHTACSAALRSMLATATSATTHPDPSPTQAATQTNRLPAPPASASPPSLRPSIPTPRYGNIRPGKQAYAHTHRLLRRLLLNPLALAAVWRTAAARPLAARPAFTGGAAVARQASRAVAPHLQLQQFARGAGWAVSSY